MTESKFKEWYASNSEDWNKQRRDRYKTDAEYKKTVLDRNRLHRDVKKKKVQTEHRKEKAVQKAQVKDRWKGIVVDVDGKPVTMFTIGALARGLGVSVQAVRLWERQGVLPPPDHRTSGSQRLYSLEEIEARRKLLIGSGRIEKNRRTHEKEVARGYTRTVQYPGGQQKTEQLYTVGVLAETVKLTVVTITAHERAGHIPMTPLKGSSVGRRLYTQPMIEVIRQEFASRTPPIRGADAWKSLHDGVVAGWKKLGVLEAAVVESE